LWQPNKEVCELLCDQPPVPVFDGLSDAPPASCSLWCIPGNDIYAAKVARGQANCLEGQATALALCSAWRSEPTTAGAGGGGAHVEGGGGAGGRGRPSPSATPTATGVSAANADDMFESDRLGLALEQLLFDREQGGLTAEQRTPRRLESGDLATPPRGATARRTAPPLLGCQGDDEVPPVAPPATPPVTLPIGLARAALPSRSPAGEPDGGGLSWAGGGGTLTTRVAQLSYCAEPMVRAPRAVALCHVAELHRAQQECCEERPSPHASRCTAGNHGGYSGDSGFTSAGSGSTHHRASKYESDLQALIRRMPMPKVVAKG